MEPLTATKRENVRHDAPSPGPTSNDDGRGLAAAIVRPQLGNKRASSFLKLKTLPKQIVSKSNYAASRLVLRTRRADLLSPQDPLQQPLGKLIVQVLQGRDLAAKDRGGTSDPFLVMRFGGTRVTSPTISKTLNPVWSATTAPTSLDSSATAAILEANVYESIAFGRERVEIVAWDKDKLGKEYLGEVSVSFEDFFGPVADWQDHPPPIDFNDPYNEPGWFPLKSTKSRSTVSGELQVRLGFVAVQQEDPTGVLPKDTHDRILQALQTWLGYKTRGDPEQDVLLSSPTEGVGTHAIDDFTPLGVRESATPPEQSDFDDDDDASSVSSTTDTDTDGDYASMTSTEDETDDRQQMFTAVEEPEEYSRRLELAQKDSEASVPSIVVDEKADDGRTRVSASEPPESSPSAQTSTKRGLSLPSFMKRNSSKTTLGSTSDVGISDTEGNVSGTEKASSLAGRRRFARRKKRDAIENAIINSTDGATAVALVGAASAGFSSEGKEEKAKRRERRRAKRETRHRLKSAGLVTEGRSTADQLTEDQDVDRRRRRRIGRRRRAREGYTYEDDYDSLGLVQIEITGATDLPRFRNAIGKGYDMDPFVVCSFGRRVFRTRVIRHSLNPIWQERLFFHVRQAEVGWTIAFNVHDWDKVSSNDHVGDVVVPLSDLLGSTIKADDRGLYPADAEGKLIGDDFQPHDLPITIDRLQAQPDKTPMSKLQIRAKFTPYAALRQQFWRIFLSNYDIDQSGTVSHLEISSMLDSLGSTLTKETISSFFEHHDKQDHDELTYDEVVLSLEREVTKPKEQRRKVSPDETSNADSGSATPVIGGASGGVKAPTNVSALSFVEQQLARGEHTDMSSDMQPVEPETDVVTSEERATTVRAPDAQTQSAGAGRVPSRQTSTALSEAASDSTDDRTERVINIKECPLCRKSRMDSKAELDIITHMAICSSTDPKSVNRIVVNEYVTASQAQRKWFTKAISKATKGAYQLGADSANIIVQDRMTGALLEEKMATYVRLGMRLLYRGVGPSGGMDGQRVRRLLESMTIKQGIKYDALSSVRDIKPFIEFHNLNMDEVLDPVESFKTFNEFFYRKLKPDARPVAEPDNPKVVVSAADCRATFFESVDDATRLWIKGREFSIAKLLGDAYKDKLRQFDKASLCILRLAPQDYHRCHSCVDGVIEDIHLLPGSYFTVNPLGGTFQSGQQIEDAALTCVGTLFNVSVRSQIDVLAENKRAVVSTISPVFGECIQVWVSAMMVGSAVFTKSAGDEVKRGDEIGYFKFGGSTLVCLFNGVKFDDDLIENSKNSIETLVRVGMRIGVKRESA
ncbi:phosphatidylserine decarboxylase [Microbotryomycetes sp. JL201]|nr:phosphatidylserine decarboxylase [Microbotryomycetes sp. JL201]